MSGPASRGARDVEVVDAVAAKTLAKLPLETDEWKVDIVASGSQKALMLPPGLATLSVSDKAWKVIDTIDSPTFYFNLKAYRKSVAANDTPYTPAVTLIRGMKVAVDMINEVGIEKVWKRAALLAKATREAAKALGLEICSSSPSDSVTAIYLPEGVDDAIRKTLNGKYGISVAGGQDGWKNRVIRINHMGYIDPIETIGMLAALEYSLAQLGASVEIGKGVAAATKVLQDWE